MTIVQNNATTTDNANVPVTPQNTDINEPSHNNLHSHSPSPSINNVTIVSLTDDDNSSIADSDSDVDEIPTSASDFFKNKVICTSSGNQSHGHENGVIVINESKSVDNNNSSGKPNIGSIAVQNSSDITFGNKTFYQGPVTIKQFLLEKNQWRPTEGGSDNKAFESSNGDKSNDDKANGETSTTKDASYTNHHESWQTKWRKKLLAGNRPILIAIFITGISVIIGAIVFTNLYISTTDDEDKYPGDGEDSRINIPINSTIEWRWDVTPDLACMFQKRKQNLSVVLSLMPVMPAVPENDIKSSEYGSSLRFVSRSEWIAQPPNGDLNNLQLPSKRIIIAHTATENCSNQATCTFRVRYIQTFHMESQRWDDIGYNFLVGGDGSAYEGRGWDKEGAHTKGFNKQSICIAFIGTFNKLIPPKRQLIAAQMLIDQGVKSKKLIANYQLYGHRQLIPSESPGSALFDIIKTWSHWTEHYIP